MGKPITEGRMIRKTIADSGDFADLSPEAAVLFCMIIPHLNSHGKLQGGPAFIKEIVCPKVKYLSIEKIPLLLQEICEKTDIKWFEYDSRHWIHAVHFTKHQKLDQNKIGQDLLPTYSELNKSSQELVVHKVKDKVEVKEEAKGDFGQKQQPVDNSHTEKNPTNSKTAFLKELQDIMQEAAKKYNSNQQQMAIVNFVKCNSRSNPKAIIHCINSLIKNKSPVENIPAYLNAALKIENGKYNSRDSENENNNYKKDDLSGLAGIFKHISLGENHA